MYLLIAQQSINFHITLFVQDITVILTNKNPNITCIYKVRIKYITTRNTSMRRVFFTVVSLVIPVN